MPGKGISGFNRLSEGFRKSLFHNLFNFRDEYARGRSCMLISGFILSIINYLTTGIFYSGFLSENGINIVKIGILSFVPFLANLFSVFSPMILERFQKRKAILIGGKFIYYFLNIFCITFLPMIVKNLPENVKLASFLVIIFTANICNALVASGFTAWQVVFIPDHVRADFFAYQQTIAAVVSGVIIVISGSITDALKGSAHYSTVLMILRLAAFFFAIVDLVFNSIPKEYPYKATQHVKFSNIFRIPFRNKPFMITMIFVIVWSYFANFTFSLLDTHLLNNVHVKYTYVCVINALYSLFLIVLNKFWRKMIARYSWLKVFAFCVLMYAPTTFAYAFVNEGNYLWLMTIVRFTQHFFGVGLNITYANMGYLNMPDEDKTCYVSLHIFITNLFSLLGAITGTTIVSLMGDSVLTIFGYSLSSVPVLLLIQGVEQIVLPILVVLLMPKAMPGEEQKQKQKKVK